MFKMLIICVLLVFTKIDINESARILAVFPMPSISHQIVFRPLVQELARRGHEVVVITPNPAFRNGEAPPNLREIDVHNVSYIPRKKRLDTLPLGVKSDAIKRLQTLLEVALNLFDAQIKNEEVQKIIKDENSHFDLVITEAFARSTLAFSHRFKAPIIQVSSLGPIFDTAHIVGAPNHPTIYPIAIRQRIHNMTVWEKIKECFNNYIENRLYYAHEKARNEVLKKHFPDIPSLDILEKNVDMIFINVHPIWDNNRPVPPNVVYIGGGMHLPPKMDLSQDLQLYLDSSKNGVIYISFGTSVVSSMLSTDTIKLLAKVFSELSYDVLWKWDDDEPPSTAKNIRFSKWLPQSDLLRHPNIKLFITQGGLQSTEEAILAGVPLIGIPMLADQWYNTEKYEHHGIGLQLDMVTLSERNLKNEINTVINNERYRNNIVKLRSIMMDQPQSPLERAVWWTEYVLRHGGAKHLRSPSAYMSLTEYYEVEAIMYLLAVMLFVILISVCLIHYSIKLVLRNIKVSFKYKVKRS